MSSDIPKPRLILLNDAPLTELAEEESFGFAGRFRLVRNSAKNTITRTPFTVMVSGGWGTGKTTSMKWLEQRFKADAKAEEPVASEIPVGTCWFYPWKYQTKEDVWRGILAEVLLARLNRDKSEVKDGTEALMLVESASDFVPYFGTDWVQGLCLLPAWKDVRQELVRCWGIARRAGSAVAKATVKASAETEIEVTLFGQKVKLKGAMLEKFILAFAENVLPHRAYLNQFESKFQDEMNGWLRDGEGKELRRLCVFIDDLDRCMPDIALQTLEALKLYLNIPGLIFVVGVDREVLDKIITKKYEDMVGVDRYKEADHSGRTFGDKAKQYLDKMFQIEVHVEPSDTRFDRFLESLTSGEETKEFWQQLGESRGVFFDFIRTESKSGGLIATEDGKEDEIIGRSNGNPRAAVRALNRLMTASGYADKETTIVQACQQVAVTMVAGYRGRPDLVQTKTGREFLSAWCTAIRAIRAQTPDAPIIYETKNDTVGRDGPAEAKSPRSWEVTPLAAIAVKHPAFANEMSNRRLADILAVDVIKFSDDIVVASAPMASSRKGLSDEAYFAIGRVLAQKEGVRPDFFSREELEQWGRLDVAGSKLVSDALLSHICELTQLTELWLHSTQVQDIKPLEKLTQLTTLWLHNTQVQDISPLEKLAHLKELWLFNTPITESQVQAFHEARKNRGLPPVRIYR